MYHLPGDIQIDARTTLTNPDWKIDCVVDKINEKVCEVYVLFIRAGSFKTDSRHILTYNYSQAGTWEDADLYTALLQLPQLSGSEVVE